MQSNTYMLRGLIFILCLVTLRAAYAQDSLDGAMRYHKAEVILRAYDKAGKPQTEEGRQQLQRALVHIEDAIKAAPEDAGLWYKKALFHQHYLIDSKAALIAWQKSYALRPHPQTAAGLAEAAIEVGDYQEAILLLNKILRDAPANNNMTAALSGKLIVAYLLDGQHEQATRVAEKLQPLDHRLLTQALLVLTHAVTQQNYKAPKNAVELREELFGFYDVILQNDPIRKLLDGRQWTIGFEDENERQYVRDYFLPGESPDSWSERVSLQVLKDDGALPDAYLSDYKKYMKSRCKELDWKKLKVKKSADKSAVAAEWQADKSCNQLSHQYEITRVTQIRDKTLARIFFSSRTLDAEKQKHWRELIAEMPLKESFTGKPGDKED